MSQMTVRFVLAGDLNEEYEVMVCTPHTFVNLPHMSLCNHIFFLHSVTGQR